MNAMSQDISPRVRTVSLTVLSDQHYTLRRAEYDYLRSDGTWQRQVRESYDMGGGASVLPIDRRHGKVLLIRQFRWPVYEMGNPELLIETVAGKLDGDTPEACVMREAVEEAGAVITNPKLIFHAYMSPGAVCERLFLFAADYDSTAPRRATTGLKEEGEDISTLEVTLEEGLAMIERGEISDGKTVMMLQWAALHR
jgi:nudix-type nucleoside diphosphatase (YffH/AdpP family)